VRKIYQIYVEYFFLLNFVFLLCIWELTIVFLACSVTQLRILVTSFIGAIINCICLYIPVILLYRLLIGALLTGIIGAVILLPSKSRGNAYIKCLVIAIETAVLLGGSIAILQKFVFRSEFTLWQMCMLSMCMTGLIRFLLQKFFITRQKLFYPVILYCDNEEYSMKALIDTGNGLVEPISKKPVCLVGKDYFERQWEKEGERKEFQPVRFRAIPYHAVGTPNGILRGYEMDRLIIFTDERKVEISKPMIGISEHAVGNRGTYQMILQPQLLSEGVN